MSSEGNICGTVSCGKASTLSCPTCIKLSLPPAYFCSQECFKSSWTAHKLVHKAAAVESPLSIPSEFAGYEFTGALRPAQLSPRRTVPSHIVRPDYADHTRGVSTSEEVDKASNVTIKVYSPEEIEKIRVACRIGREVLDAAGAAVRVGITTDALDEIVHEETIRRNAYPSPLNYYKFPKSVCTSVNEVICHGIPDFRPLEDGDIVNIDVSVYYDGFHADLNETFFVGKQSADSEKLVECAYNCLAAAVALCKPGTLYRDLGEQIFTVAQTYKCSIVRTYCGHGVGTLFHTAPTIPHYPKNKAKGVMKAGHVFTIEPMINLGTFQDVRWPDEWTSVTRDGKRSSQFEHTIVVTETGCELLTAKPGEPIDRMEWKPEMFQR